MTDELELKKINRRDFLRLSGLGAVMLLSSGGVLLSDCAPAGQITSTPTSLPLAAATATAASGPPSGSSAFVPDVEIALKATKAEVPLLPGRPTRVWTYQGEVLKGDPASLQTLMNTYLGPIFRVRQGQKIRVHFTNDLAEETIVHWHGLHVPAVMDGHPRYAISPGQTYVYEFEVRNRAGTYWFHPHPDGRTGKQTYFGLAGLFLVSDDEENAAGLPGGDYDIPLVIQDRAFDADNQLVYLFNGMMDRMMGFLGERIMVNGQLDFTLSVATRAYRLRLLNGSNSRIYKLAWEDGTPLTVIGTDGGLLEEPVQREYVTLAPAERVELWVDFSGRRVGTEMVLQSLPFAGETTGGMGGGMMRGRQVLPNGATFPVLRVRVEREEKETLSLPQRLSTIARYRVEEAVNRNNLRTFRMAMQRMAWTINGRIFEMEDVADDEIVRLNTLEVWELVNEAASTGMGRGMGMALPHPIHIHGLQFQVLERQVSPQLAAALETVRYGYVDEGWKDTVLLMPGERVKILLRFEDYTGLFLYHCHNLEHEDMGMMRNYLVRV